MAPRPPNPWSTSLPAAQDTVGVEQPDLFNDSAPGANDGDIYLAEHLHALRDKLQYCMEQVGDASSLPGGCLKALVATLNAGHALLHELGGAGEISVAGLSGVLADKQDADKLQGRDLASTAPGAGEVLGWNDGLSQWEPVALSETITPHLEEFVTDGEAEDSTFYLDLAEQPKGSADTPSGYAILAVRREISLSEGEEGAGRLTGGMRYNASPADKWEYGYDSVNNRIEVKAPAPGGYSPGPLYAAGMESPNVKVLVFDGTTWEYLSGFPTVVGQPRSIYAYDSDNMWVCGTTGSGSGNHGFLYSYGSSTWTNRLAAALAALGYSEDAYTYCSFNGVHGTAADDVYICGELVYSEGETLYETGFILHWNGSAFSAFTNDETNEEMWAVACSPGGYVVAQSSSKIYMNTAGSWFESVDIGVSVTDNWNSIKAYSNQSIRLVHGNRHYLNNGTSWLYETRTDSSNGDASAVDGLNAGDYWTASLASNPDLIKHIEDGIDTEYSDASGPWTTEVSDVLVLAENDVWICGSYQSAVGPNLYRWNGTAWSADDDFELDDFTNTLHLYALSGVDSGGLDPVNYHQWHYEVLYHS